MTRRNKQQAIHKAKRSHKKWRANYEKFLESETPEVDFYELFALKAKLDKETSNE